MGLILQTGSTSRLFISGGSGNVGIGTTTPSAKLDLWGAPNTNLLFLRDSSDGEYTHNFWVDSTGHGHTYMYAEGNSLKIDLNTAGSSYFNGGNVGIGISSPAEKLTVCGNISASGTIMGLNVPDIGTGTAGYITKWEDANTIGNSMRT